MNEAQTPQTTRVINKLTVRDCGAKPDITKIVEHNKAHPGEPLWLVTIVGNASDFKGGMAAATQTEFVKLLGTFKGVNMETGIEYRSGACILPGAASDLVYGALKAQMNSDTFAGVGFVFKIGVTFDESTPVNYRMNVETVVQPSESDPLLALEKQAALLALPAGSTAPAASPEADAKKKK